MLANIIKCYWQVCIFRRSPESTPYSSLLMILSALTFSILIMIQWALAAVKPSITMSTSIIAAVSLVFSYVVYSYVLLKLYRFAARLVQTLTALWMTHLLIHLCAIPLLLFIPILSEANMKNPVVLFLAIMYLFATIGLSIWQFVVTAHIYKHALEVSTLQSFLASVGLLALNILTVSIWQ